MNVDLTPDQREFVQRAIESGRIQNEEQAVRQALALWEERERRRLEILSDFERHLAGGREVGGFAPAGPPTRSLASTPLTALSLPEGLDDEAAEEVIRLVARIERRPIYSARSASTGSMRVTRRAGR
jgi:putative addiction module CopG family antidote